MKALVVDTSSAMRSVLHRILSMRRFNVAEVETREQAMDILRRLGAVDLVLIDWIPHDYESLEVVARMRRELAHDATVFVMAAGEPDLRDLHRAITAGSDDYLLKPFTSLQLDEKLGQAGFHLEM